MHSRPLVPALALLFSAAALTASAQVTERIDVSAIEVPVVVRDAKGNVPRDLKPSDFLLLEDGKPQEIIGVAYPVRAIPSPGPLAPLGVRALPPGEGGGEGPPPKRWQVVIFLQQSLSSGHGLKIALEALVPRAGELTAMGEVEIAGDQGGTPKVLVAATGDEATLRANLADVARRVRGQEQVVLVRKQFEEESMDVGRAMPHSGGLRARVTARVEALIVRSRQDAMLGFLGRYNDSGRPHALLFVSNGFDLDPTPFYGATMDSALNAELRTLSAAPRQVEMAQALAATGWTVLSFAPGWMETAGAPDFDASASGHGRLNAFLRDPSGGSALSSLNLAPLDPMLVLAEETGGSLLVDPRRLAAGIDELANRVVVTYMLHRARDGRAHRIQVVPLRAGITVRAQRTVVSGAPEALAVARAAQLAGGEGEKGELPVRCTLKDRGDTASMTIAVDLSPIEAVRSSLADGTLRFSIAVHYDDAPPFTISKRMENLDLTTKAKWAIDFQVRHRPRAKIGVVAEEMATGAWGGAPCATMTTPVPP